MTHLVENRALANMGYILTSKIRINAWEAQFDFKDEIMVIILS